MIETINIQKYAAIDIGSNAMRLLVSNIVNQEGKATQFTKSSLVRVPIRLGQDAFTVGEISQENIERMCDAMNAFKLLIKVHKVEKHLAFATSAMREAYNNKDVINIIKAETDMDVEIIGGEKEARIIASTNIDSIIQLRKNFLYVDVGGGSSEFTLFCEGKVVCSKSFKVGTVRQINKMVTDVVWQELERWIKEKTNGLTDLSLIGSGGNINRIFKMSGKAQNKPLPYTYMSSLNTMLNKTTYEQRVYDLGMNPDRADVIIPALRIYLSAMKWSGAKQIFVPKIGLSDGIIKAMFFGYI